MTTATKTPTTVYDTRRENLRRLLYGRGAKTLLAQKLGTNQTHISHMVRDPDKAGARLIHEDKAREIEDALNLEAGALDKGGPDPVLRTGDGTVAFLQMKPAPAPPPSPADEADLELLEASVRAVITAAADTHSKIVAEKTASIVRLVYAHGKAMGHIDPTFVQQLVKLMR